MAKFVGRDADLTKLHDRLQETQRIAITAVTGMGGIGKTELALQYARRYRTEFYPGGVCWLPSRDADPGLGILNFARVHLGINPPDDLTLEQRVRYCWNHWPIAGDILAICDDVTDYQKVKPFLPPDDSRFKVIMTTRSQKLHQAFERLPLEVLSKDAAVEMLQSLIDKSRIEAELEAAKGLCEWLGYLPLGLELVGQYLDEREDLSLVAMRGRLEKKRLEQTALREYTTEATAQLGVKAAFELSWQDLPEKAREVACLLSLFAVAPIPWGLVQECFEGDEEELEDVRDRILVKLSLLQRLEAGWFQLHPLLQRFMGDKLQESETAEMRKQKYCRVMVKVAQQMPPTPTLEQVEGFAVFIPHLEVVAKHLCNAIEDDDLMWPFVGIARYYEGQGLYSQAEPYFKQCLLVSRDRLGEEHPDVATSLNHLAGLYRSQGRYEEAEPLYLQALELRKKLLGEEHPYVASSLNNLAELYRSQGRYEEAEPLYLQALELSQKLLGEEHLDVATSLNNLALLYSFQGRYREAEPFFLQALELYKKLLGKEHLSVATSLNNLAGLYRSQGKYREAESLLLQALELRKNLLGKEHPDVATSLNNLAELYRSQRKYREAEPLHLQALELRKNLLGEEHPDVAQSLNNLALLYRYQGRYEEAEPLYLQSLELRKNLLGKEHPDVATSLNNLASLYRYQERYEEAEPLHLQALELRKNLLGKEHPDVAQSLNNLALLYGSQERYEEAEPLYLQAVEILMSRLGIEHPDTQVGVQNLGNCLQSAVAAGQRDIFSNHPITQQLLAQIDAANEKE